jgi:hypothetical protein
LYSDGGVPAMRLRYHARRAATRKACTLQESGATRDRCRSATPYTDRSRLSEVPFRFILDPNGCITAVWVYKLHTRNTSATVDTHAPVVKTVLTTCSDGVLRRSTIEVLDDVFTAT